MRPSHFHWCCAELMVALRGSAAAVVHTIQDLVCVLNAQLDPEKYLPFSVDDIRIERAQVAAIGVGGYGLPYRVVSIRGMKSAPDVWIIGGYLTKGGVENADYTKLFSRASQAAPA